MDTETEEYSNVLQSARTKCGRETVMGEEEGVCLTSILKNPIRNVQLGRIENFYQFHFLYIPYTWKMFGTSGKTCLQSIEHKKKRDVV